MKKQFFIALRMFAIMTFLLGISYPLLITGFAQLFYPSRANGSLLEADGKIRGSVLIGQQITDPRYFATRPSVIDYKFPSGGSNLGLTNKNLHETVAIRKNEFLEKNKLDSTSVIPSEMLFASGSGLDPHISPDAAKLQIHRIAETRNYSAEQKQKLYILIDRLTEAPQFGILGCSRINVFMLNLELDKLK